MVGPPLIMNYVRTQVKNGDWVSVDPVVVNSEPVENPDKVNKNE